MTMDISIEIKVKFKIRNALKYIYAFPKKLRPIYPLPGPVETTVDHRTREKKFNRVLSTFSTMILKFKFN